MNEIKTILADVHAILRKRLADQGLVVEHVILAITPDGKTCIVRGDVTPGGMGSMAVFLATAATNAPAVSEMDVLN